jgi:CheY-like chemotaxis protein
MSRIGLWSPAPRGARVLVVDDNHDAAMTLATLLELSGYCTRSAHDGLQALEMAQVFAPDVALLDIGLPLLGGHELAQRLRRAPGGARLVLVALTGWGCAPDREASKAAGFDAHVVKPVEPDALLHLLAELVARRAMAA